MPDDSEGQKTTRTVGRTESRAISYALISEVLKDGTLVVTVTSVTSSRSTGKCVTAKDDEE